MSRPHTYVGEYTTKDERFGVYGILKREKQSTKRTCAQPEKIRVIPENEIPPAMRVDIYSIIRIM